MTDSAARPSLFLHESTALTAAFVDRVARDRGIRALFIKGAGLTSQGLREEHASIDVDVLVHPDDLGTALDALAALEWTVPVPMTGAQVLPLHSATLKHRSWICEIDLHDRFPGFLQDPGTVFDELWRRRSTVLVAGRALPVPDETSHAVVAALHWLRDGTARHAGELDYLYRRLRTVLTPAQRDAMVELAQATGAIQTLRPLWAALDIRDLPHEALDETDWRIRVASGRTKSVGWVVELSRLPWRQRPARLWQAIVLTEGEIRKEQPRAAPGWWGLQRARLHRLGYGLRALPKAIRIVWRERRRS
jgi:hypothetical protein